MTPLPASQRSCPRFRAKPKDHGMNPCRGSHLAQTAPVKDTMTTLGGAVRLLGAGPPRKPTQRDKTITTTEPVHLDITFFIKVPLDRTPPNRRNQSWTNHTLTPCTGPTAEGRRPTGSATPTGEATPLTITPLTQHWATTPNRHSPAQSTHQETRSSSTVGPRTERKPGKSHSARTRRTTPLSGAPMQ